MLNGGSDTSAALSTKSKDNPDFTASREQFSTNFRFAGHSIPMSVLWRCITVSYCYP